MCHNKLVNTYVLCRDCNSIYCKIPYLCKYCNNLLINDMLLSQVKTEHPDQKIINHFKKISTIHSLFFDNKLILNGRKIQTDGYEFFVKYYLDFIKTKKDLIKSISKDFKKDDIFLTLSLPMTSAITQIKILICYIKFKLDNALYSNLDKSLVYVKQEEFIHKTQNLFLKDVLTCLGCEFSLEKAKNMHYLMDFWICEKCLEIYCR